MRPATISNLQDRTTEDARTGAMRSVQAADLSLPEAALRELWSPLSLERLARTYWRFITRVTLGLIRVRYSQTERSAVLMGLRLRLLTFAAPEYELGPGHGIVRWRIARGLLVARHGHGGAGHLQIDVRRLADAAPGQARLHVEVEVANFHPAIASGFGLRIYNATQARIHVLVTHGFLRSLARLDLADRGDPGQRVGRFAGPEEPGASA
jgi:hypothetical protein